MSYLFNDLVGFKGNAVDAFNRLKIASPFTIFDSQHRYKINSKWNYIGFTGATSSYVIEESAVNLTAGLTIGSKICVETKNVFPYQPGKSLLVINSFVFAQPKTGLRQRLGFYGITGGATSGTPYNGIYLEQNGLTLNLVLQSASLNTTTTVNQQNWNVDKFDGSGISGRTLDITKANIFWMDIEWLGVGDVRCGFFVDGRPMIAHIFHNDNVNTTTYMTTSVLPIRYEVENTAGQTGNSTAKQICSTVISEGGYEGFSREFSISTGFTATGLTTIGTEYPIIALRLNSNRLDSIIIPSNISVALEETGSNKPDIALYKIILNPTIVGATWNTHSNGSVDYALKPTSISGGTEIISGYVSSNTQLDISKINDFNFQLGRSHVGISDTIVLTMIPTNADGKVFADMSWYEII